MKNIILLFGFGLFCFSTYSQIDFYKELNINQYSEVINSISNFEDTNEYDHDNDPDLSYGIGHELLFSKNNITLLSYFIAGSHPNEYLCLVDEGNFEFFDPKNRNKIIKRVLKKTRKCKLSIEDKSSLIEKLISFYVKNENQNVLFIE